MRDAEEGPNGCRYTVCRRKRTLRRLSCPSVHFQHLATDKRCASANGSGIDEALRPQVDRPGLSRYQFANVAGDYAFDRRVCTVDSPPCHMIIPNPEEK